VLGDREGTPSAGSTVTRSPGEVATTPVPFVTWTQKEELPLSTGVVYVALVAPLMRLVLLQNLPVYHW
jgi:hypothetical protein